MSRRKPRKCDDVHQRNVRRAYVYMRFFQLITHNAIITYMMVNVYIYFTVRDRKAGASGP